ncbi:hypothetical protein [Thermococcus sp.]
MNMLKEITNLEKGIILLTGDAKKFGRIYLKSWLERGLKVLAEELPFDLKEEGLFIGSPYKGKLFDAYLLLNPLSRPRAILYSWLEENRDKLVLLYEQKYVKDSIVRYEIKELIDYLIAYKRETVGFEKVDVYKLKNGKIVERKSYIRRAL